MEAGARLLLLVAAVLLCLYVRPGRAAPLAAEVAEFPGFIGNLGTSPPSTTPGMICRLSMKNLREYHVDLTPGGRRTVTF